MANSIKRIVALPGDKVYIKGWNSTAIRVEVIQVLCLKTKTQYRVCSNEGRYSTETVLYATISDCNKNICMFTPVDSKKLPKFDIGETVYYIYERLLYVRELNKNILSYVVKSNIIQNIILEDNVDYCFVKLGPSGLEINETVHIPKLYKTYDECAAIAVFEEK